MKLIQDAQGIYHAHFRTQKGTTGSVDLGTNDPTQAEQLAKEVHIPELETVSSIVDLSHQVVTQIVAGKKLTVLDAVREWYEQAKAGKVLSPTTVHANKQFLDQWVREMGLVDKPLTAVLPKDVSDYVNRGGERRSSALRKLSAIRSFFAFCQDNGYMYRNPAGKSLVKVGYEVFRHEEKEKIEREVFSDADIQRLLQVASPFWKAAITIGRETGLRLGDIAKLEWDSLKNGRIIVWTDKANKRVDMPVGANVLAVLDALPSTDIRYVFPREREVASSPARRAALSVQFSRLCSSVGISGKSFHCLRHTNATGLVQAGAPLEVVAKRLGHSSTVTTNGYVHYPTRAGTA